MRSSSRLSIVHAASKEVAAVTSIELRNGATLSIANSVIMIDFSKATYSFIQIDSTFDLTRKLPSNYKSLNGFKAGSAKKLIAVLHATRSNLPLNEAAMRKLNLSQTIITSILMFVDTIKDACSKLEAT